MNETIKKRLIRTLILSAIALVLGGTIALIEVQGRKAHVRHKGSTALPVAGLQLGGEFALTDHTGQAVTQESYAGQYKLIYFGFTYCPAICPTELQKISQVMDMLGDASDNIQPLFITVDPERDTVPVMKEYVGLFHPRLVGLSGTAAQIEDAQKNFRVYARKVQPPDMSDYTMDHSSYIYFMSPEGTLLSIYRIQDTADFIVRDIQSKMENSI